MSAPLPPTTPALSRRIADATRTGLAHARTGLATSRAHAGRVRGHARDMFAPLLHLGRGFRREIAWARNWWKEATPDRRKGALVGAVAVGVLLYFLPYGPLLALGTLMAGAAWMGRDRTPPPPPGPPPGDNRLQAIYNGLVPHLADPHDPDARFEAGAPHAKAFEHHEFEGDQLTRLELRYSPYFADDDPEARHRIERVIEAKAGRAREYLYGWDTEANRLTVAALPPLPGPVPAQPYVTAPCEIVLGFTDPTSTNRLIPVTTSTAADADPDGTQLPPVVWRTGTRTNAPHLLAVGGPASGKTTLLRTIAVQALRDGDVLAVDATGSGDFACLAGRTGVLRVETTQNGAREALTWLREETARRAAAIAEAKRSGRAAPEDARRPLCVLLDEPADLADPDVHTLLDLPLRLGRTTHVSIVATARPAQLDRLHPGLLSETHTRVALGPLDAATRAAALGSAPGIAGGEGVPAGRGYARVGGGPVIRLQTPYTPDPLEDDTPDADRTRVLALLPPVAAQGVLPVHGTETQTTAAAPSLVKTI